MNFATLKIGHSEVSTDIDHVIQADVQFKEI